MHIIQTLFKLSLINVLALGINILALGQNPSASSAGQVRVPDRSPAALFKGEQGKQRTQIFFDPSTRVVTLKLLVQDPNGYFIPNLRRENFAVYENDIRQTSATVEIEHANVSMALLLELGGRYPAWNKVLVGKVSMATREVLDAVGREDKIAIWKYADHPELLIDFTMDHEKLNELPFSLKPPSVSEANMYDAVVAVLSRMQDVSGRKAIILISSGIDTFSKTTYEDVLKAARNSNTPIYAISIGAMAREAAELPGTVAPFERLDWKRAEHDLQEIARTSGGRAYFPTTSLDLSAISDDMMENLKVRYVVTYKSTSTADPNMPRTVRVELVNPKTGGPLKIVDASGRTIHASVVVQDSYIPSKEAREAVR